MVPIVKQYGNHKLLPWFYYKLNQETMGYYSFKPYGNHKLTWFYYKIQQQKTWFPIVKPYGNHKLTMVLLQIKPKNHGYYS